jgi:hypothetical protein
MWCVYPCTSICAGQCISMSLYERAQCIHGGIHTCYVQSVTCMCVCICTCLYLHRSHVWQQVYVRQSVNVCMCQHVYVHRHSVMCAHKHTTHMECLKVPELINSLTWHYSAGNIRYAGCPSRIGVILLSNKDWYLSSEHSMAKNFKVEEELMMPTVLQMFKSISWGDNYKLIMKLLSNSCIHNFH